MSFDVLRSEYTTLYNRVAQKIVQVYITPPFSVDNAYKCRFRRKIIRNMIMFYHKFMGKLVVSPFYLNALLRCTLFDNLEFLKMLPHLRWLKPCVPVVYIKFHLEQGCRNLGACVGTRKVCISPWSYKTDVFS